MTRFIPAPCVNHRHHASAGGQVIIIRGETWRRYINSECRIVTITVPLVTWGRRPARIRYGRVVVLTKNEGPRQ